MPKQSDLPVVGHTFTRAQARKLALAAFVLGGLSIVANGLTAVGFMPTWAMQLCGGTAAICTTLSWYCARQAPSPRAQPTNSGDSGVVGETRG